MMLPFKAFWLRIRLPLSLLLPIATLLMGAWVGHKTTTQWAQWGCLPFTSTWQQAPSPPLQQANEVRLVAVGDIGHGNAAHLAVVNRIKAVCQRQGCDFLLLLGDNFYPSGVDSTQDAHWQRIFARTYGRLNIPVYALLGNHDVYRNAFAQVQYAQLHPHWNMLDFRYQLKAGPLDLYALNTNCGVFEWQRLKNQLSNTPPAQRRHHRAAWTIAAGHRPVFTTGKHKDANWLTRSAWENTTPFLDLTLGGHSHMLEHLQHPPTNTIHITSGAGSVNADDLKRNTPVQPSKAKHIFRDQQAGFVWIHLTQTTLNGIFYGTQNDILHTWKQTK